MQLAPITPIRTQPLCCPECTKPLTNTGGYLNPRYRCIQRECANTVFKPIDPKQTTWTALRYI